MCKSRPKCGQISRHSCLQIRAGKCPKLMTAHGIKRRETPSCTTAASLLAHCLPSVDLVESRGDNEQETSCAVVGTDAARGEKGASPEGRSLPHVGGGSSGKRLAPRGKSGGKGRLLLTAMTLQPGVLFSMLQSKGKADFSSSGQIKGCRWWLSPSRCMGHMVQA